METRDSTKRHEATIEWNKLDLRIFDLRRENASMPMHVLDESARVTAHDVAMLTQYRSAVQYQLPNAGRYARNKTKQSADIRP